MIALSNSSLLIFLPACGLWMIWPELRGSCGSAWAWGAALARAAMAAVCCAAVMAPWIVRNERALGSFVPMRSNFGAEFYASLQPENGAFPVGRDGAAAGNGSGI